MLVVENQHDTKDCPYELLFYPLKMLLTGGAVEFSIREGFLVFRQYYFTLKRAHAVTFLPVIIDLSRCEEHYPTAKFESLKDGWC